MHDIDRNQLEALEFGEFEFESEFEFPGELQEVFNEGEQMELAAELLEVRDEQELNHFLGDLIRKASGVLGKAVHSPLGQQLGGILKANAKNAALQAVPVVSDAIGSRVGGRLGASIAKGLTAFGTSAIGQSTKRSIRKTANSKGPSGSCSSPPIRSSTRRGASGADPRMVARSAIIKAAQSVAPGLLQAGAGANYAPRPGGRGQSGVWYRSGNRIVLQGA